MTSPCGASPSCPGLLFHSDQVWYTSRTFFLTTQYPLFASRNFISQTVTLHCGVSHWLTLEAPHLTILSERLLWHLSASLIILPRMVGNSDSPTTSSSQVLELQICAVKSNCMWYWAWTQSCKVHAGWAQPELNPQPFFLSTKTDPSVKCYTLTQLQTASTCQWVFNSCVELV